MAGDWEHRSWTQGDGDRMGIERVRFGMKISGGGKSEMELCMKGRKRGKSKGGLGAGKLDDEKLGMGKLDYLLIKQQMQ